MSDVKLHLAVATPMHGGLCVADYTSGVMRLQQAMKQSGFQLTHLKLGNESHIQRARNTLAWHFRQTDATHLLFWDGDQGCRFEDIARMVSADVGVIVGPVPMKGINWDRVWAAARSGVPAAELFRYTGVFNIVPKPGAFVSPVAPFELERGGSGLMLIKREVFAKVEPLAERYANDLPGDAMPLGVTVHDFFPSPIVNGRLMSEDFGFCELAKRAGYAIWAAPWCEIVHHGNYRFEGSYAECLRMDAELKTNAQLQALEGTDDGAVSQRQAEARAA